MLAVVGFRLFPEKDVTILNDGQAYRVSATFDARNEALDAAEIALSPGDRVLEGTGGNHVSFAVQRARPVTIDVDGRSVALRTRATTIAGALADAGVELRPGDRVALDGRRATSRGPLVASALSVRRAPTAPNEAPVGSHITVERARPVMVYIDTLPVEAISAAPTVRDLLDELGITVREVDLVRPSLDSALTAGETVRLARARSITVRLDGKDQTLYTLASTVADVVRVLGLTMGPKDSVVPAPSTPILNGSVVVISTTRTVEEVKEEPIPPLIIDENDPNANVGTERLVEGRAGVRKVTYRVTLENGVEVGKPQEVKSEVVAQPVHTRRIIGTKPVPGSVKPTLNVDNTGGGSAAASPAFNRPYKRKLTVLATWYDASHGVWDRGSPHYGTTASGMQAGFGVCAVDPTVIPMGTRFYVPGYGDCIAGDTGGLIKGHRIDVGFAEGDGHWWGIRTVDIYILD